MAFSAFGLSRHIMPLQEHDFDTGLGLTCLALQQDIVS